MDWCPHCGEPIEDEAAACPHCGSDHETGWSPEADHYALDLPDYDDEDGILDSGEGGGAGRRRRRGAPAGTGMAARAAGGAFLALGLVLFLAAGYPAYGWAIALPAALLAAAAWYIERVAGREPA